MDVYIVVVVAVVIDFKPRYLKPVSRLYIYL